MPGQPVLHHLEQRMAALQQFGHALGRRLRAALRIDLQGRAHGDHALVLVLLPEHPAQHGGALEGVLRHEARALAQPAQDRVRFRQQPPVVQLQHRRLAKGQPPRRLGRRQRLGQIFDIHDLAIAPQQRQGQPNLVTVAG